MHETSKEGLLFESPFVTVRSVKEALPARVVAHCLGGEDVFSKGARQALEEAGVRLLFAPGRAALRKLVTVIPADILLASAALLRDAPRAIPALKRLYGRKGLTLFVLARENTPAEKIARFLTAGASDVLAASIEPALLAARIDAALRTVEQLASPSAWPRGVLRTADGEIAVDLRANQCLVRNGDGYQEILLTRKQLAALAALLRAAGGPVRWGDLFRRGWRPGKLRAQSRTLVQHIIVLRRKLGPAGRRIAAIPSVGYRLAP